MPFVQVEMKKYEKIKELELPQTPIKHVRRSMDISALKKNKLFME